MPIPDKPISFIMACKDFFGYKEGQSLKEFSEEVKQLTDKDREDLSQGLSSLGYQLK